MSIFRPVNQSGKKNVADLQRLINLMAHTRVSVDGVLGPKTLDAIWTAPKESQQLLDAFGKVRQVAFPRVPPAPKSTWNRQELVKLVRDTAIKHQVNPDLAELIVTIESDFNPNAVSGTGADGLFQLTNIAVKDVVKDHPRLARPDGAGRRDPQWNATVGVLFLKKIMKTYLMFNPLTESLDKWVDTYAVFNLGIGSFRALEKGEYNDPKLNEALRSQASYLRAGGPTRYLAAVQSKMESVIA
jgi:soluble lytic murein transglycosylase-like protein